jgi:DNA-binding transcriptional MocR family regulator
MLALPTGAEGPDLAALETILENQRVRLILVTPNFQNPTGATMTAEARQQLLRLAQRFQTPVAENDSYGWLGFAAKTPPALKALDHHSGVIYLGSFSKAGFPGLRLGWCIAPPEATARLRRAKQATDLHTDQFVQAVMVEFARGSSGKSALDRAVDAVRAACRSNAARLTKEVARYFPGEVVWRPPQGGMSAWFRLPEGVTADAVLARSREHHVVFTPGRYFYFQAQRPETFRLSFGNVRSADIARGIKILGEAIRAEIRATAARSRRPPARGAGWSLV